MASPNKRKAPATDENSLSSSSSVDSTASNELLCIVQTSIHEVAKELKIVIDNIKQTMLSQLQMEATDPDFNVNLLHDKKMKTFFHLQRYESKQLFKLLSSETVRDSIKRVVEQEYSIYCVLWRVEEATIDMIGCLKQTTTLTDNLVHELTLLARTS